MSRINFIQVFLENFNNMFRQDDKPDENEIKCPTQKIKGKRFVQITRESVQISTSLKNIWLEN